MRARALLLAILSTSIPACGLVATGDDGSEATPLPNPTSTTSTSTSTTTLPPRPALTYVADLLDGGTLTIVEGRGELSEFTEGKPTAVHELDELAAIPDCEAIGLRVWEWTARAGPGDAGQKASAYAKHGDNLYKFLGCGTPDAPQP